MLKLRIFKKKNLLLNLNLLEKLDMVMEFRFTVQKKMKILRNMKDNGIKTNEMVLEAVFILMDHVIRVILKMI